MTTRLAPAAAMVAGLVATGAGPEAQQRPEFRGATDLVSLYVTATDEDGRLVTDLTREDFVIKDEGKAQPIAFFSATLEPFTAVVMLDRSGTMKPHFGLVRDAAIEFVRQMWPDDRARVGSFADEIRLGPADFTSDKNVLFNVLRFDLQDGGASPAWSAIDHSMTALANEPGRRVVLVLTDGKDDPLYGQPVTRLGDLLDRTEREDIMIYAVGFAAVSRAGSRIGPFGLPTGRGPVTGRRTFFTVPRAQPPDPALEDMADNSGGGYFEPEEDTDLQRTFARVAEELHRQYWLGFVPPKLDGKTHDVTVEVRRRGVKARARKSYVASTDGAQRAPGGAR
jgi:Ca-activated chloride channel family protein